MYSTQKLLGSTAAGKAKEKKFIGDSQKDFMNPKLTETVEITNTLMSNASSNGSTISNRSGHSTLAPENTSINMLEPSSPEPKTPSEWYSFIQERRRADSNKNLLQYYATAMRQIDFKQYANDLHLVAIWLEFINLQKNENVPEDTLLKIYEKMQHLGIGQKVASFYIQWAEFDRPRALDILNMGMKNKAKPISSIMMQLKRLETDTDPTMKPLKEKSPRLSNVKPSGVKKQALPDDDDSIPQAPVLSTEKPSRSRSQVEMIPPAIQEKIPEVQPEKIAEVPAVVKSVPKEELQTMTIVVDEDLTQQKQKEDENNTIVSCSIDDSSRRTGSDQMKKTGHSSLFSRKNTIQVNGTPYMKLELVGRGGSSKVFKVLAMTGKIFAIKRVQLSGVDSSTVNGYLNEIALLKKLNSCDQIIKLYDSEINRKDGVLYMVMECGEIDLAHVLKLQEGQPINLNFVRVHWEQMLEAVHAIHEERVVHSDLKPANFLFVRGGLKLIDFGIAKTINADTTNIHRDSTVGTVNYMSPEAIIDTNALKGKESKVQCMKLGRSSDVWSLGCILYQMIFSKTPFSHLTMFAKIQAIIDPDVPIEYPSTCQNRYLLDVIKSCLIRDPKSRKTIPELLNHPFLHPDSIPEANHEVIRKIVKRTVLECTKSSKIDLDELTNRIIQENSL